MHHAPLDELFEGLDLEILKLIKDNQSITYALLAEALNVHIATIRRHIKSLIESGHLTRKNGKRYGTWHLNL